VRELENVVQRMLFFKTEGCSLSLADWMTQAVAENVAEPSDFLTEAAGAAWKAISASGIPYTQAFREIEKKVLQAAISAPGYTRRQLAQRLHTSERTLYYKMRSLGLASA